MPPLPHYQQIRMIGGSQSTPNWVKPKDKPSPNKSDFENPLFESLFQEIKNWDIRIPEYDMGYCSGNGSHVKILLDIIMPHIRDSKIDQILQ